MKILLVDDEAFLSAALEDLLTQEGHQCLVVNDGERALELMTEEQPHVVVTDFNMPGLNGIQLLRLGKQVCPQARFVILTGYASMENSIDAVNLGAYAYFRKPLNPQDLLRTLEAIAKQVAEENSDKVRASSLRNEHKRLRAELATLERMLGHVSPPSRTPPRNVDSTGC